jgi:hypothetical protein
MHVDMIALIAGTTGNERPFYVKGGSAEKLTHLFYLADSQLQ